MYVRCLGDMLFLLIIGNKEEEYYRKQCFYNSACMCFHAPYLSISVPSLSYCCKKEKRLVRSYFIGS